MGSPNQIDQVHNIIQVKKSCDSVLTQFLAPL